MLNDYMAYGQGDIVDQLVPARNTEKVGTAVDRRVIASDVPVD